VGVWRVRVQGVGGTGQLVRRDQRQQGEEERLGLVEAVFEAFYVALCGPSEEEVSQYFPANCMTDNMGSTKSKLRSLSGEHRRAHKTRKCPQTRTNV
jgi:hypothetical protein